MIRSLLIVILIVAFLILSIPILIVEWIIGKFNPYARDISSLRIVQFMFKLILFIAGTKVTVIGEDRIPKDTPVLYVGNHRSYFDILVGYTTGPMPLAFVSKDDLAHIPLITRWMKYMKCLFLDRNDIKKGLQTILEGIELLKSGHSVFIAPEGTRNHGEELLEFHQASFKLADKSHRPIVPVAMNNTDDAFENHFPWIHSTHVIVEYCKPIYMDELEKTEKKHVAEKVREIIGETVKKNAAEL